MTRLPNTRDKDTFTSNSFMMCVAGDSFSFVCGLATLAVQEAQTLPGKGLNQHPFLYCGEWREKSLDHQTMLRIGHGQIAWRFTSPHHGELGDCSRLSNGNIVFSRQFGASEVTPDKKIV